jgi:hypothetical protein
VKAPIRTSITEHSESSHGDPSRVSARQALRELVALSVHGVELRTYVDEFLNSDGILAEFEIDHAGTAGIGTGEVIYFDKPSEALLDALVTARAMKANLLLEAVDGAHGTQPSN